MFNSFYYIAAIVAISELIALFHGIAIAANYECVVLQGYYANTEWPPAFWQGAGTISDYYYKTGISWNSSTPPHFTRPSDSSDYVRGRPFFQAVKGNNYFFIVRAYDLDLKRWTSHGFWDPTVYTFSQSGMNAFLDMPFVHHGDSYPACGDIIPTARENLGAVQSEMCQ